MKIVGIIATALLIFASAFFVLAQQAGSKRTDLQRHDLSAPGREVVQVRVEFAAGYLAPRHSHPGEEVVYVLEGTLEYYIEGRPPVTLKPGGVLFIPAGAIHSAKNIGSTSGAELATYIVEKGKPLVTVVTSDSGAALSRSD